MVGRLLSFGEGNFSGAMSNFIYIYIPVTTTVDPSKKSISGGFYPSRPHKEMEKIPIDGEMSAVLVERYVNVSRAIDCLCPTDQHCSGILWGSLRVTPHPTQKRPTLAA